MSAAKIRLFLQNISRKQPLEPEREVSSSRRSLTTLDLLTTGIGSTLGAGVYMLSGEVARTVAGPSVSISFLLAALVSIFAALCYAEFGVRVPKTGSVYIYSYVTLGEIWAFIAGWNILLSYVIGTASVARAWSGTFDELIGNVIENSLRKQAAMNVPGLAPYPDLLAAGLILLLAGMFAFGVKKLASVNKLFTAANILVLLFIIVSGFIKGNINNWYIDEESLLDQFKNDTSLNDTSLNGTASFGRGGFFPFGFAGTLAGAATCFFTFVGFDNIATSGEEAQNPQKSIPVAIVLTLLISTLMYFGVSASLTLMMPYHLLSVQSPFPVAFTYVGWGPAKYVVAVGSLCAMSTSLFGSMLSMPRVVFAMARDGLLFRSLSKMSKRESPVTATLASGVVAAILALLFDLKVLIDTLSVGNLIAYTLVAICILVIRYKADIGEGLNFDRPEAFSITRVFFPPSEATSRTSKNVSVFNVFVVFLAIILSLILTWAGDSLQALEWWSLLCVSIIVLMLVLVTLIIWRQPQNTSTSAFMVPFVPFLPILVIFVNIYFMVQLGSDTWICYAVWMTIGLIIYFSYGVQHSAQKQTPQNSDDHSVITIPDIVEQNSAPELPAQRMPQNSGDHGVITIPDIVEQNSAPDLPAQRTPQNSGDHDVITIPDIVEQNSAPELPAQRTPQNSGDHGVITIPAIVEQNSAPELPAQRTPQNSGDHSVITIPDIVEQNSAPELPAQRTPQNSGDHGVITIPAIVEQNSAPELPAQRTPQNSGDYSVITIPDIVEQNSAPELPAQRTPQNSGDHGVITIPAIVEQNSAPELPAQRTPQNSGDHSVITIPDIVEQNSAPELPAQRTPQNSGDHGVITIPAIVEQNSAPELPAQRMPQNSGDHGIITIPDIVEQNFEPQLPAQRTPQNSDDYVVITIPDIVEQNFEPQLPGPLTEEGKIFLY